MLLNRLNCCKSKFARGFFKIVEETPTLLLLLPKLFAETPVFGSTDGLS
jgi:hypothetical protein